MIGKKNGSGFIVYLTAVLFLQIFWKILIAYQLSGSELIAY